MVQFVNLQSETDAQSPVEEPEDHSETSTVLKKSLRLCVSASLREAYHFPSWRKMVIDLRWIALRGGAECCIDSVVRIFIFTHVIFKPNTKCRDDRGDVVHCRFLLGW
jgi:hypothetical protein